MTPRSIVALVALLVALGINAYLLWTEEVAPTAAQAQFLAVREDPLLGARFTRGSRQANLTAYGVPTDDLPGILERMTDLTDRDGAKIAALLEQAPDPTGLADALCGQTNRERPRYEALRYLVAQNQGQRKPIRLRRVTELPEQPWAVTAPIGAVYEHVELTKDREPDATVMGLAAILALREQTLLQNEAPWGRGLAATWSWSAVRDEVPGIESAVYEYLAVFHVVAEVAHADGGLCGL